MMKQVHCARWLLTSELLLLLLSSLVVDVTICTIGEIRDDLSDRDGILVAAGLRIDAEDLLIALQVFKWHSTGGQENADIQQQRAFQAARLACRRLEPANVKCIKAADDCDLAAADEAVRGCLDQMVVVFAGRQVLLSPADKQLDDGWWESAHSKLFAFEINARAHSVLEQRHPRGHCLFTTRLCPIHRDLEGLMVDEREHVYEELARLPNEDERREHCLQRARANWEWCGHAQDAAMSMVWRPATYSLTDSFWSSFPQPLPGGSCDGRQRMESLPGVRQADTPGGWKTVHVWVEGSTYGGREIAHGPPPDVLARELLRHPELGLAGDVNQVMLAAAIDQISAEWTQIRLAQDNDRAVPRPSQQFHGQLLQDSWVATIFGGKRSGFFVDLAAHDAVALSNTLSLERDFAWRGLCIEPNHEHLRGLAFRNCSVVSAVVSNETGRRVRFDADFGSVFASIVSLESQPKPVKVGDDQPAGAPVNYRDVGSVTIGKILHDFEAPSTIDYLSLDIEGSEEMILQTFPFARRACCGVGAGKAEEGGLGEEGYSVMVVSIEHPNKCSRTHLRRHGFLFLAGLGQFSGGSFADEIWVHETLYDLDRVMRDMGIPEPARAPGKPTLEAERCDEMTKTLAHHDMTRHNLATSGRDNPS